MQGRYGCYSVTLQPVPTQSFFPPFLKSFISVFGSVNIKVLPPVEKSRFKGKYVRFKVFWIEGNISLVKIVACYHVYAVVPHVRLTSNNIARIQIRARRAFGMCRVLRISFPACILSTSPLPFRIAPGSRSNFAIPLHGVFSSV